MYSVFSSYSNSIYVDVARTYVLFVRNNQKIFHDLRGYIFITTYRNCIASRVYETCPQLCMWKKCLILLRLSAKMTSHCYLQWIWGPNNMTVSLFFLEHVSQSCHKGFLEASVGDTKPDMHFILWHRSACMMRAKPGALFKKCELKR